MSLNILFKTTSHVSIGDDIAFYGTKRIFDRVLPGHNAFVFSRNEKDSWKRALDIDIDLVVIAGTPVWSGSQMASLEEFIITKKKPTFYCGVGMAYGNNDRTSAALANSIGFIGRDNWAVKRAWQDTDAAVICCPSIFSVDAQPQTDKKIGIVLQVDTFPEKQLRLINRFKKEELVIICNEIVDYVWAEKNLPDYEILYSRWLPDMARFYLRCKEIYTMRIHGAHLAYALGIPTVCTKNEKDKSVVCHKIGVKLVDPDLVTAADLSNDQSIKARKWTEYMEYVSTRIEDRFPGVVPEHVLAEAKVAGDKLRADIAAGLVPAPDSGPKRTPKKKDIAGGSGTENAQHIPMAALAAGALS
ncbi:MAG TPA: polysaccharide pyruvyl transferase family protein [Rhizomicrobium sp.]|nr:polysaccharide pyruvyl transferase family protein [Rhizomicrobium sp.]